MNFRASHRKVGSIVPSSPLKGGFRARETDSHKWERTMYDGAKIRMEARIAAKSIADGTVKTTPYGFGRPALLVHRLDMEVVLRDGMDERIERGDGFHWFRRPVAYPGAPVMYSPHASISPRRSSSMSERM